MTQIQGTALPSFVSSYLEEKRVMTSEDEEFINAAAASLYSGERIRVIFSSWRSLGVYNVGGTETVTYLLFLKAWWFILMTNAL